MIEKVMTGSYDLEQVLISKNKERFWGPNPKEDTGLNTLGAQPFLVLIGETPQLNSEDVGKMLARTSAGLLEVNYVQILLKGVG